MGWEPDCPFIYEESSQCLQICLRVCVCTFLCVCADGGLGEILGTLYSIMHCNKSTTQTVAVRNKYLSHAVNKNQTL